MGLKEKFLGLFKDEKEEVTFDMNLVTMRLDPKYIDEFSLRLLNSFSGVEFTKREAMMSMRIFVMTRDKIYNNVITIEQTMYVIKFKEIGLISKVVDNGFSSNTEFMNIVETVYMRTKKKYRDDMIDSLY